MSPKIHEELPRKAIIHLTYIYNAISCTEYVLEQCKRTQVIKLLKSGNPPEDLTSYQPISLFPCLSKLLDKLLLNKSYTNYRRKIILYRDISLGSSTNIQWLINFIASLLWKLKLLKTKHNCWRVFHDVAQEVNQMDQTAWTTPTYLMCTSWIILDRSSNPIRTCRSGNRMEIYISTMYIDILCLEAIAYVVPSVAKLLVLRIYCTFYFSSLLLLR